MKTKLVAILALGLIVMGAASCGIGDKYASSTSDTHVCVFDGSERGGQKLKFQIAPGAESKRIDDNDQTVKIPASNRFYMASIDDAVRDPLAPKYYEAYAEHSVSIQVQGQIRFKFNLDNACDWYSKHGRRNANGSGDLGFNARGGDALSAGWFHYLAENFGQNMQQAVNETVGTFNAYSLVFHYPDNSDEFGILPQDVTPGRDANLDLGDALGKSFTSIMNAQLGGVYFCGVDQVTKPDGSIDPCPPLTFQVIAVHTSDPSFEQGRQNVEKTKQDLANASTQGNLAQQQAAALAATAEAQRAIKEQQKQDALDQATIDNAKCLVLADHGLDCEGHRPQPIVTAN